MRPHDYPGLNIHDSEFDISPIENERIVFGFWMFLMSDMVIFGIFFATYVSSVTPMGIAGGPGPQDLFDLQSVGIQTLLLLLSALTCGFAGLAMKYNRNLLRVELWLLITALMGLAFLSISYQDFQEIWSKGGTPMRSNWLTSFYSLVGLHFIHVFVGVFWAITCIALAIWRPESARNQTRLLLFMLYWHFLDIVWIGIFSFVFLRGMVG